MGWGKGKGKSSGGKKQEKEGKDKNGDVHPTESPAQQDKGGWDSHRPWPSCEGERESRKTCADWQWLRRCGQCRSYIENSARTGPAVIFELGATSHVLAWTERIASRSACGSVPLGAAFWWCSLTWATLCCNHFAMPTRTACEQWSKPWLFAVYRLQYRGLYYPVI